MEDKIKYEQRVLDRKLKVDREGTLDTWVRSNYRTDPVSELR